MNTDIVRGLHERFSVAQDIFEAWLPEGQNPNDVVNWTDAIDTWLGEVDVDVARRGTIASTGTVPALVAEWTQYYEVYNADIRDEWAAAAREHDELGYEMERSTR